MDRRERERNDYGNYDDYRNDAHYHSARNLTDDFERDYRNNRGNRDNGLYQHDRVRSYHEGNMDDAYERRNREENDFRGNYDHRQNDRNQNRGFQENRNSERDRFSNYQDDYRSYQGMDSSDSMDNDRGLRGNIRQGYGISSFEGTSDRFNTLNTSQNRGGAGDDKPYYSGSSGSAGGSTRFGGSMGESFPASNRGVPDATYGHRNFSDNYGTGMGSTYGGQNYGGGTGYSGEHRGGSFGNQTYGTSSGNYGGYGSMGSGSYGGRSGTGRDSTSHNSDRGTNELGGF